MIFRPLVRHDILSAGQVLRISFLAERERVFLRGVEVSIHRSLGSVVGNVAPTPVPAAFRSVFFGVVAHQHTYRNQEGNLTIRNMTIRIMTALLAES